jgi:rhamnogalacturonyl hydrolase YesR
MINEKPIKKWVKVGKDENTGLWYYENSRGVRSQAIFANRKKAWAKGNDYIDMLYPKKNKRRGTNGI